MDTLAKVSTSEKNSVARKSQNGLLSTHGWSFLLVGGTTFWLSEHEQSQPAHMQRNRPKLRETLLGVIHNKTTV